MSSSCVPCSTTRPCSSTTIRSASRIVVLDQGRVVEQGTHEDLLEAGGPYERLYRDWAEQAAA